IYEYNIPTRTFSFLVYSGLSGPRAVAVDGSGNVYIADSGHNAIKEFNPATRQVTTLVSSGLLTPSGVGVEASGNVYIADSGPNPLKQYTAAPHQVTTLTSPNPFAVAVDGSGTVYIADSRYLAIRALPQAFIPGDEVSVGPAGGSASLLPVLPTSQPL